MFCSKNKNKCNNAGGQPDSCNKKTNDVYEDLAVDIEKILDDYDSEEKDAKAAITAVYLESLKAKLKPYHEKLQNLEEYGLFGHIGMITGLLSDKHLTDKEEQQVKEKLRRIKKIINDIDGSKDEKDQVIADIFSKIEDLLLEILTLISGAGN